MGSGIVENAAALIGPRNVRTGPSACEKYNHDSTGEYRGECLAVALPSTAEEVAALLALANRTSTPVVPFGGNTGVSGGTAVGPGGDALVLSLERMDRIRSVSAETRTAVAEAGVVLETLQDAAAREGLSFPLNLGARGSCTIGGNLSTNAGGSNVLRHGNVRSLCLGIEVATPQGEIMDLMTNLHKDNSGYALKDLYIGSEGTLGIITAAILKLFPMPKAHATALVGTGSLSSALRLLNRLQSASGGSVEAFEYMPDGYMRNLGIRYPDLKSPLGKRHPVCLLIETAATSEADAAADGEGVVAVERQLQEFLSDALESGEAEDAVVAANERQRRDIWKIRDVAFEVSNMRHPLVHNDIALPLDKVEPFVLRMESALPAVAPGAESITVGHLGDGNLHYNVWLDRCADPTDDRLRDAVMDAVEDAAHELGGTFSAEHGIGASKLGTMARRKDPAALSAMRAIKQALDPNGIMNPGKVVPMPTS